MSSEPAPVCHAGIYRALKGMHVPQVHRDIKPANVLMDLNGRAKIADFGISAYVDNTLAVVRSPLQDLQPIMLLDFRMPIIFGLLLQGKSNCVPPAVEPAGMSVQCHTFTGTVTYMSPERIDSQPYSFPADIWSVPTPHHHGLHLAGLRLWCQCQQASPRGLLARQRLGLSSVHIPLPGAAHRTHRSRALLTLTWTCAGA